MVDYIKEKDWVPVTESMFLKDADVIAGVLEHEGVSTKVVEPTSVRYSTFAPQLKTAQVMVPRQLLQSAKGILEAKEKEAEQRE